MKHFLLILAAVLFCSVCFVPADDAPIEAFILWAVYAVCMLWLVRVIWRGIQEWGF